MSALGIAKRVISIRLVQRCLTVKGVVFLLLIILQSVGLVALCFAQFEIEGIITAGSVDNQMKIAVLNSDDNLPIRNLSLSVSNTPKWITNIRIESDSKDELPPGKSRIFTIRFDAPANVQASITETVVFKVSADMIVLDYPRPQMNVRIESSKIESGKATVQAFPLKPGAPEKIPMEQAVTHCVLDVKTINEYDRIVVFFTPKRNLSEGYPEEFRYRLKDSSGKKISGGDWIKTDPGEQNPSAPVRTTPNSPGLLAINHIIPLNIHQPGIFVLETIRLKRTSGAGLFGQGQGHAEDGEWQEEGRFEVREGLIYFQGFVAEPVENHPMPRKATGVARWSGVSNIERLDVNHDNATASIEIAAHYTPATKDRNGILKPVNKEWTGRTQLFLAYPKMIRLGRAEVIRDSRGKISNKNNVANITVEWIVKGDARYTPNMLPPTPIRQIPPSREPFESQNGIKLLRAIFWPHTIGLDHWLPEEGKRSIFTINEVFPSEVIGDPPLTLAEHFRDPDSLWVFPVRLVHSDDVKVYAYAIYKSRPGRYDGPLPAPLPGSNSAGQEEVEPSTTQPPSPTPIPENLDPGQNAKVAALIREWLATAKPPENAVPGSNWRYDPFGRIVGSGPGLRTTSTHDSVGYGGGTPEASAWTLRKKLDSINHCTLEEYVVAKLEKKSISHCAGRYGAVRDLKGMRLDQAKTTVTGAGFGYSLAPGSPAKTLDQENTVERQTPGPEQYLRKGQILELTFHSPYVPAGVTLPDLTQQKLADAKKWLEKNKLKADIQYGSPAPTAIKSGTIEKQEPAPGTQIKEGEKVTLNVHSNFVDLRKVPDVTGRPAGEARRIVEQVGLRPVIGSGGAPSSKEQAGTVQHQRPEHGASVTVGSEVALAVYGPFVETIVVPDLQRLSYEEAKRRLEAAGLSITRQDAGRPNQRDLADTFQKQDPQPGTKVFKGQVVRVWFYGQYIPTREEQVAALNCSGYPGSRAYWDNNEGKPMCGCFDGLTWNLANTRCVTEDVRANELCARHFPGSVPNGKTPDGKTICDCPQDYTWTADRTHCEKRIPPEELCASNYPGSVPTGRDANGKVICDCPQGYVWTADKRSCVKANTDWRGWNRSQQCEHKISTIRNFMYLYRMNPRQNTLQKQMAENIAREASALGCDEGQINQALGTGGGGDDNPCDCVDERGRPYREAFGQPCGTSSATLRDYNCRGGGGGNSQQRTPGSCFEPGMSIIHWLIDPPPYAGRNPICKDGSGNRWFNTANFVHPVVRINMGPFNRQIGCYSASEVITPTRTFPGTLCGP
ncbi:MAG: PASTA domain-containing protein [Chloroflexota bacterium]